MHTERLEAKLQTDGQEDDGETPAYPFWIGASASGKQDTSYILRTHLIHL